MNWWTDGLITEEDFYDYTFANAATLYAGMNPDFFKGTVCEAAVAKLLQRSSQNISAGGFDMTRDALHRRPASPVRIHGADRPCAKDSGIFARE